jgi:hypothetical protein
MYQAGELKLDELVTREYTLDQVAEAYEDMHAGRNIRGIISLRLTVPLLPQHPPGCWGSGVQGRWTSATNSATWSTRAFWCGSRSWPPMPPTTGRMPSSRTWTPARVSMVASPQNGT